MVGIKKSSMFVGYRQTKKLAVRNNPFTQKPGAYTVPGFLFLVSSGSFS